MLRQKCSLVGLPPKSHVSEIKSLAMVSNAMQGVPQNLQRIVKGLLPFANQKCNLWQKHDKRPQNNQPHWEKQKYYIGQKFIILMYCMEFVIRCNNLGLNNSIKILVCHKMPDWKQVVGVCAFWCRPLQLQERRRGGGSNKSGRCGVKVGPADLKVQWVNLAGQGCNLDQYFLQF